MTMSQQQPHASVQTTCRVHDDDHHGSRHHRDASAHEPTTTMTTTAAAAAAVTSASVDADEAEPPIRAVRHDKDDDEKAYVVAGESVADNDDEDAVVAATGGGALSLTTTTTTTTKTNACCCRPHDTVSSSLSSLSSGKATTEAAAAVATTVTTATTAAIPSSWPATAPTRSTTAAAHYNTFASSSSSSVTAALQRSCVWRRVARVVRAVIPYGGLVSNCFSLSSVTLGGGIIAMPSSFATSGIAMAIVYLVVLALLTVYSMLVMGYVMQRTHGRTFEQTATLLAGARCGYFVGAVLWVSCIGAAIAYVSAVSGLLYPIVQHAPYAPAYLKTDSGNRLLTSLVWLCGMLPFVVPRRVNSLRYLSAVGCSMVVYFVAVLVVHSCTHGLPTGMRGDMRYVTTGNKALYGLSIFMFAFLCQAMSQPVYYEMRPRPSVRQLTVASAVAVAVCTLLYILAGLFGYLDFGDATRDSVLYNFDPVHSPYVMVAYAGMLLKLCAAYAVNMIPCRNVVYHCLHWDVDTLPYAKHIAVVVGMSVAVLLCGLFVPSVNTAFGLVGSLCGGFTGFVFPALLYMYSGNWSRKTVGWGNYVGTYVLLLSGVVAICFGTVATIYSSFFDT